MVISESLWGAQKERPVLIADTGIETMGESRPDAGADRRAHPPESQHGDMSWNSVIFCREGSVAQAQHAFIASSAEQTQKSTVFWLSEHL